MTEFYTNVHLSRGKILVRGYADGKPFKESVDYKPHHFVPSKTPTEFKTLDGKYVARVDFSSVYDAKEFVKKWEDVDNFAIYGSDKYVYTYIYEKYKNVKFDFDQISIVPLDIEVASDTGFPEPRFADKEITAISLRKKGRTIVLGTVDYKEHRDDVVYIRCKDEKDLIYKFIDVWKKLDPDIVTGWNIESFDIPYLVNRITKVCGESVAKMLSPWLQIHEYTIKSRYGDDHQGFRIVGIATIDMMEAYRKFTFKNQESFSLNHIAHVELGEKKIDYSEFESLHDLYLKDPQKFIEYNIHDTDLVERIADKTGLLRQITTLAYTMGLNYVDAFTSVLLWETIIQNSLMDEGIVVPTARKRNYKDGQIMGAFVKEPRPGKYKWVVGLDLDSLYPHLIMQYNISPETFVDCKNSLANTMSIDRLLAGEIKDDPLIRERIEDRNLAYTPNGAFFRKDSRGFLPKLMDTFYNDRKRYKGLMIEAKKKNKESPSEELESLISQYHNMQMALKIALNSAYGALTNVWFFMFDIDLGEAITYGGQLAIKWIARDLNAYINKILGTEEIDYVIASDTDSAYITLDGLVKKVMPEETDSLKVVDFLNKVCTEKINPFIRRSYEGLAEYTNAYEQKMSMKVESISEAGIWKAKKRYALSVWWDEGVLNKEVELKIKGMEAVQSSTPAICKPKMEQGLKLILADKKTEFYKMVSDFKEEFQSSPFESVAATTSVSDIDKYADQHSVYKKGTPFHVRGALLYNRMIKEKKIDRTYKAINSGDKVKTCYMKTPNPINENVIAIYTKFPPEFGLSSFVDYDTQFDKEFIDPMNKIAMLVGWDLRNRSTLDSFFA